MNVCFALWCLALARRTLLCNQECWVLNSIEGCVDAAAAAAAANLILRVPDHTESNSPFYDRAKVENDTVWNLLRSYFVFFWHFSAHV